jgi:hypothetical protein
MKSVSLLKYQTFTITLYCYLVKKKIQLFMASGVVLTPLPMVYTLHTWEGRQDSNPS